AAVGGPGYAAGLHNQAIDLAGTGKYVNCGNDASFNISGAITLSALINGTFNNPSGSLGRIVEKGYNWMLCRGYGDSAAFYCLGFGILEGSVNINDNQWHHVAAVYDGSKMYLYVDGRLDAVKNASGSLKVSTANVYIGGNPSQSFNGLIDDVLIYNRALSKSEIEYLSVRTDINTDGTVNFGDFALLADNWLQ
ncbi:MAG TPA: LamG domain-containing protein, partial [Sedimentisphaerales bacterium]|nr:LamG domain-containing protein [Sedimentisphaerales bacterium]